MHFMHDEKEMRMILVLMVMKIPVLMIMEIPMLLTVLMRSEGGRAF